MKRKFLNLLVISIIIGMALNISCSKDEDNLQPKQEFIQEDDPADPSNEFSGIITPEDELISFSHETYNELYESEGNLKYGWVAHKNFTYVCAKKLGLSESRAIIMRDASVMPDVYQVGIDNFYNQQWSHAFIVTETWWGVQWLWGDADDDFHDNLDGDSGESESPEGYNSKWAGYYYQAGNRDLGDWYVGYACHFMEDVSLVLHTTFPDIPLATHHGDYEDWIDNNWTAGHNFAAVVESVSASSYYAFSNPKSAINAAAKSSNWDYSSYGRKAWENYEDSGYPTAAGTGNSNCVYYTKLMLIEATKWTGATIKYGLNKYNQW